MSTLPLFGYVPTEDRARLKTALQRVFWTLTSGDWVQAPDLQKVGGLSWGSRVRSLREPRFGGMEIEVRASDQPGIYEYRLHLESVPTWAWIVFRTGKFPPVFKPSRAGLEKRLSVAGKVLPQDVLLLAVEIVEALGGPQGPENGSEK
ncbi:MAG: hypothetical protein CMJ75_22855 [Planctomycetaceae bacterium]|nr:hypothetical protein [Planctomycetaceae bacterium]